LSGGKLTAVARLMRGIALLTAGVIIGSALFMLVYRHNFSKLVAENSVLRTENAKLTEDVKQLRRNQKDYSIIRRIDAHLQTDAASPITPEVAEVLEKRVRDELKVVYNQKIETAKDNVPVYDKLVSSKTYANVFDKTYAVNVKFFALIGTELTVWFTARELHTTTPGVS
jgi:hypothetical protein